MTSKEKSAITKPEGCVAVQPPLDSSSFFSCRRFCSWSFPLYQISPPLWRIVNNKKLERPRLIMPLTAESQRSLTALYGEMKNFDWKIFQGSFAPKKNHPLWVKQDRECHIRLRTQKAVRGRLERWVVAWMVFCVTLHSFFNRKKSLRR